MMWSNAGYSQASINFLEGRLGDAELMHQTRMIAKKLEAAGWDPYRSNAGEVVQVGLMSGALIRDGGWRNTNVLPYIAKRNRANMLGAFTLWLHETAGATAYCRYCVISSGVRCSLDELPERLAWFNRKLSKFVEWSKEAPHWVRVELITIEATFKREEDGTVSVNLHSNVVYWPQKALGPERWTEFLKKMRTHFETQQIQDAGIIQKPEELIKYALKPAEVMQLTPRELAVLAETLHKRQLVRPVGDFAAFRKGIKKQGAKVSYKRDEKMWVRSETRTKEEAFIAEMEQELRETPECNPVDADREGAISQEAKKKAEPIENQVLFQTLPQARATAFTEAFVGIRNYTPTPKTERGRKGLAIIEERRAAFLRILLQKGVDTATFPAAEASRLDTCTIIPLEAVDGFSNLTATRQKRILRQLGIPENEYSRFLAGDAQDELTARMRRKLERVLPTERHPWAIATADLIMELEEILAREEAAENEAMAREEKRTEIAAANPVVAAVLEAFPKARITVDGEDLDEEIDDIPDDVEGTSSSPIPTSIRSRVFEAIDERRRAEVKARQSA